MTPYRTREPPIENRFERTLSGFLTRASISPHRVRVDAPDAMAIITATAPIALLFPLAAQWSLALAFAGSLLVLFTTRVHLRVERDRVRVVRSTLGIPWSFSARSCANDAVSIDWDDQGEDLVVASRSGDPERAILVLSTSLHGVGPLELREIESACARVLAQS